MVLLLALRTAWTNSVQVSTFVLDARRRGQNLVRNFVGLLLLLPRCRNSWCVLVSRAMFLHIWPSMLVRMRCVLGRRCTGLGALVSLAVLWKLMMVCR